MASNDALLRRIATRSGPRRDAHTGAGSIAELEASVMTNLRRILGSRVGIAPACPNYGLPEFDYVADGYTEQARRFAAGIKETIEAYEPRVTDVRVITPRLEERLRTDDPMVLRVEIKARLNIPGTRHKARFEATLSADGRVDIGGR